MTWVGPGFPYTSGLPSRLPDRPKPNRQPSIQHVSSGHVCKRHPWWSITSRFLGILILELRVSLRRTASETGSQKMKVAQTESIQQVTISHTTVFCLQTDLCFLFPSLSFVHGEPHVVERGWPTRASVHTPARGMRQWTGLRLRKSRPTQPQHSGHELDSRAGWRGGNSMVGESIWRTRREETPVSIGPALQFWGRNPLFFSLLFFFFVFACSRTGPAFRVTPCYPSMG